MKPLRDLKGVGSAIENRLAKLNLFTLEDLLFHLPRKYQDKTKITLLADLQPLQDAQIEGVVNSVSVLYRPKRMLNIAFKVEDTIVHILFFNFYQNMLQQLKKGCALRIYGQARLVGKNWQFVNPEYSILYNSQEEKLPNALTPLYPTTDKLTQNRLRQLLHQAFSWYQKQPLQDWMPVSLQEKLNFPDWLESFKTLHFPAKSEDVQSILNFEHPAQQRLIFEELLAHHLLLKEKLQLKQQYPATPMFLSDDLKKQFLAQLPFSLTSAQQKVVTEILLDMNKQVAMARLVQGDVGSGKTVVSAIAALAALASGKQVVLMAPTELLIKQHGKNFAHWLGAFGYETVCLTGKTTAKERQVTEQKLADAKPKLIIGTHALFQEGIQFINVGLLMIDEQHRFGVQQRMALLEKVSDDKTSTHQLVLTATPIPRTLTMLFYADLSCSVIDEKPPGRKSVKTLVLDNNKRDEVIERIRKSIQKGRQVYWVCPLIEENNPSMQSAENLLATLQQQFGEDVVCWLHGKMKPEQKNTIMENFINKKFSILVSTTVIEVGVDVPNASIMIIENTERFGLAQLHQLRGRVGRGQQESFCLMLYQAPLTSQAIERLHILRDCEDGFKIAEKDLQMRGAGELLGTKQAGSAQFKIADLFRDQAWLTKIPPIAEELMLHYPQSVTLLLESWFHNFEQGGACASGY